MSLSFPRRIDLELTRIYWAVVLFATDASELGTTISSPEVSISLSRGAWGGNWLGTTSASLFFQWLSGSMPTPHHTNELVTVMGGI